jgi:hypothetical protein
MSKYDIDKVTVSLLRKLSSDKGAFIGPSLCKRTLRGEKNCMYEKENERREKNVLVLFFFTYDQE